MFDSAYVDDLLLHNKGSSLVTLWLWSKNYPPFNGNLAAAKNGFFYLAERFMREGILKLGHGGIFLPGTIEDQLRRFQDAWPEEYDENVEEKDIDNLWWLVYAPAGAVWIYPDGYEEWA
jgi:hypothetical protein